MDVRDCIVYNAAGARHGRVVIGVEGLAIVVTEDGVLVRSEKTRPGCQAKS